MQEDKIESENTEEVDVDVMEFALNEQEIDELIAKLNELKQTKKEINFEIDDENEFLIKYEALEENDGGEND